MRTFRVLLAVVVSLGVGVARAQNPALPSSSLGSGANLGQVLGNLGNLGGPAANSPFSRGLGQVVSGWANNGIHGQQLADQIHWLQQARSQGGNLSSFRDRDDFWRRDGDRWVRNGRGNNFRDDRRGQDRDDQFRDRDRDRGRDRDDHSRNDRDRANRDRDDHRHDHYARRDHDPHGMNHPHQTAKPGDFGRHNGPALRQNPAGWHPGDNHWSNFSGHLGHGPLSHIGHGRGK